MLPYSIENRTTLQKQRFFELLRIRLGSLGREFRQREDERAQREPVLDVSIFENVDSVRGSTRVLRVIVAGHFDDIDNGDDTQLCARQPRDSKAKAFSRLFAMLSRCRLAAAVAGPAGAVFERQAGIRVDWDKWQIVGHERVERNGVRSVVEAIGHERKTL